MCPSLSGHYLIKNPIPIVAPFIFLSFLYLYLSIFMSANEILAMKDSSLPKKRSISALSNSSLVTTTSQEPEKILQGDHTPMKKLRRLPHVFSRVLELPFKSDADVSIQESSSYYRFTVSVTDDLCGGEEEIKAHTVEIHPGVVKVVVRGSGRDVLELLQTDELKLDVWRFRLPSTTLPGKATAVCMDGELVVTVPKDSDVNNSENGGGEGELWNGVGRLVLVQ